MAEGRDRTKDIERAQRTVNPRVVWSLLGFVVPMLLAIGLTGWGRLDRKEAALDWLKCTANAIDGPCHNPSKRPTCGEVVDKRVADQLGDKPDPAEVARARDLLGVIANQLDATDAGAPPSGPDASANISETPTEPDPAASRARVDAFAARADEDLFWNFALDMMVIGFVCLVVFGLFLVDVFRARREILALDPKLKSFPTNREDVEFDRNLRGVERRIYFVRRFGVMLMLTTGVSYLLAPVGIQASILGEYTTLHPIVGHASLPFWLTQMKHASPAAVGFLGFLAYVVISLGQRVANRDLSDRVFVSLLNRGLLVIILSLILGAVTDGSNAGRAFIFLVGIMPATGVEALATLAKMKVSTVTIEQTAGFEILPEIDLAKQTTLRELGINDANDLARTNLSELVRDVGMEPGIILRAADRAILIHYLGPAPAKRLESIPIYTATELLDYASDNMEKGAFVARAAGDGQAAQGAFEVQLEELRNDPNVRYLLAVSEEFGSY